MEMDFNLEEQRKDSPMVLVSNETLTKLENNYLVSLKTLNELKTLINYNNYLKLEINYYKNELSPNEKESFLNYKNNLEKLQLETNIKESYFEILRKFQNNQIEYATFVSERNNELNFVTGNEYGIDSNKIVPILNESIANKNVLINIHNHPRDNFISNSDIKLLTNKNISSMHIISGNRIQIFDKLNDFNIVEFDVLFKNELTNLLINKDKIYSNDFYENKLIQREIQLLNEIDKNRLLNMIMLEIQSKEIGSGPLESFDNISDLMIRMNIQTDNYYDSFEMALKSTLDVLKSKNKINYKEMKI